MVLGQAWALLLVIELGLRLLSFRSLLDFCHRWSRSAQAGPHAGSVSIERYAWLAGVAGRYSPVRSTCLKQTLVLSLLLERQGMATQLRFGVSRRTGSFKAHAWLEREEEVIFDLHEAGMYEPLLPALQDGV